MKLKIVRPEDGPAAQPTAAKAKPAAPEAPATKRLMTAAFPADKSRVTLHLQPESGARGQITLTPNGLLKLIQTLGRIHAALAEGKEIPPLEAAPAEAVFDTRWQIGPGLMGEATRMSFHHPGYGPVSFLVPNPQVRVILDLLRQHLEAAETMSHSPKN